MNVITRVRRAGSHQTLETLWKFRSQLRFGLKMSEKSNSQVEDQTPSFKEKCVSCIKGHNLIKTVIVLACTGVLVQQISACIGKLVNRPITTYTHFDFNRTLLYPSITFCREPAYKYNKMHEYGLYAHPRYTSTWRKYNFSFSLSDLWRNITYEPEEFFAQYGLEGMKDNVEIKTTIGFLNGRCYTLSPRIRSRKATRKSGYSVTLQYNFNDIVETTSTHLPGYHVYVHYTREPYTEVAVYNGGLVDYLYCNVGETIDVKLTVNQYMKISQNEDVCVTDDGYSANTCTTRYVWDRVGRMAGCSGPWMENSSLPQCSNFTAMRKLIAAYTLLQEHHNSTVCPRFCRSFLYQAFVNERSTFMWNPATQMWAAKPDEAALQTQLFLYFNSMMVSVYEERYNYDWNLFISDLGGSVGFLLGLSVIGLMSIVGKIWATFIKPYKKQAQVEQNEKENPFNTEKCNQGIEACHKIKFNISYH
ncbi:hypothetical protein ACJJTC_010610 [Scirpophaga incertulas]